METIDPRRFCRIVVATANAKIISIVCVHACVRVLYAELFVTVKEFHFARSQVIYLSLLCIHTAIHTQCAYICIYYAATTSLHCHHCMYARANLFTL